jgi:hypothetical protein
MLSLRDCFARLADAPGIGAAIYHDIDQWHGRTPSN